MIQQSHCWAFIQTKLIQTDTWTLMFTATLFKIAKTETTWVSIGRWMDKKDVVHMHNGILLSHKQWNNTIHSNTDGLEDYHTEWDKSDGARQVSHISLMHTI